MMSGIKYVLIGFGFIFNGAIVFADNNLNDTVKAAAITNKQGDVKLVENVAIGIKYKTKAAKKVTTQTPVENIPWTKLPKGRQISPIYGDMKKGHHVTFIKFAPGLKTQTHIHSHDYTGVVVKGVMRHYEPGKPETKKLLHPGSTWTVPGNIVHISECSSKSECVFVIHQERSFDRKVIKNK